MRSDFYLYFSETARDNESLHLSSDDEMYIYFYCMPRIRFWSIVYVFLFFSLQEWMSHREDWLLVSIMGRKTYFALDIIWNITVKKKDFSIVNYLSFSVVIFFYILLYTGVLQSATVQKKKVWITNPAACNHTALLSFLDPSPKYSLPICLPKWENLVNRFSIITFIILMS